MVCSSLGALALLLGLCSAVSISVASSGGNATSPFAYGLMFEDISHSGDGGLYAELIRNRAFQGGTLEAWSVLDNVTSGIALDTSQPLSHALQYSIQLTTTSSTGVSGISNPGWWGMAVQAGAVYNGSFYSRGHFVGTFTVSLVSDITGQVLASANISSRSVAQSWTQHTYELVPAESAANANNSFVLSYHAAAGTVLNFNLISLFPPTYKKRPNGNRPDLMEILKDLNPSYLRAPGGNNLEGSSAPDYWNWSATLGSLTDRRGRMGTWGYPNSDGLGLVEYMNWCTDLDMEPILAVWGGLYLDGEVVSEADLGYYVQDTLNELEFLMGNTSTHWGSIRAQLGHPEPWPIRYVEVGNEDNLNDGEGSYAQYRFKMFFDAITKTYPHILVISSTTAFTYRRSGQDYHQYTRPSLFVSQFDYFDNWALGHPIMIGEYASVQNNTEDDPSAVVDWSRAKNEYTYWIGAISEAVFLLGAERNSDKIFGSSFAPLLQNLNSFQWTPDLISFTADPAQTVLSVAYSVIRLFSNNRISETLPAASPNAYGPAYWVAGQNSDSYILKLAIYNSTAGSEPFNVSFPGLGPSAQAELTVISAPGGPYARNTPAKRNVLTTAQTKLKVSNGAFHFSMPDFSVAVLKVRKDVKRT